MDVGSNINDKRPSEKDLIDESTIIIEDPVVVDRYNLCAFFGFFFGVCSLLPWNTLLAAIIFLGNKLGEGSLRTLFSSTFCCSANITLVLAFFVNTFFLYKYNRTIRIVVALVLQLVGFIVLIVFIPLDVSKYETTYFVCAMVIFALLSIASTILQSSLFAGFAYFPPSYLTKLFTGQGVSGLFVITISILTTATRLSPEAVNYMFFGIVMFLIILTLILYAVFIRTNYYKYVMKEEKKESSNNSPKDITIKHAFTKYFQILKKVKYQALTIFLTFFCTLFYFPRIPFKWKSCGTNETWKNVYYIQVIVLLMFNLGDTLGRLVIRFISWPKGNSCILPILAALRLLFIFPFGMCHIDDNFLGGLLPQIFKHDACPAIFIFIFAFTNGYYPTVAFGVAPSLVEPEEMEFCNSLLVFLLGVGLALGSACSFIF